MSGGDQEQSVEADPARPFEAQPTVARADLADIDGLIREAVQRIASSLSPVEAVPATLAAAEQPEVGPRIDMIAMDAATQAPVVDPEAAPDVRSEPDIEGDGAAAVAPAEVEAGVGVVTAVAEQPPAARAGAPEDSAISSRWGTALFKGPWTWRRIAKLAGLAVAAYFGAVLFLILIYRFINPPTTTLIAYQWMTGTDIEQEWVPIENISPNLLRAVVVSEDWGFCDHYGVDIEALEKALELAGEGKIARGASTISMQVIKNLFLSQSKSYVRKAVEIPLTIAAETVWPKSRMLEIYLNIAEWGPGVFGAEAAARHHFNKPASKLTEREAALLAAALPNPILRDAGDPGTRTARKASVIQVRMRAAGPSVADCAMIGRKPPRDRAAGAAPEPSGWQTTVKKRAGADEGL